MKPLGERARTILARASLAVAGGALVADGVFHWSAAGWQTVVTGAMVGGAGLLLSRRTALAQVLARGAAWSVIVPFAVVSALAIPHGFFPSALMAVPAAVSAAALWLSRPLLQTEEARADFNPSAFRGLLLLAASLAVGVGAAALRFGAALMSFDLLKMHGAAVIALALASIASGVGLAKMRSWGVLLGAGTAIAALALTPMLGVGWIVALAAAPGLLMVLAIALARAGFGREAEPELPRVRVAAPAERVADPLEDDVVADEFADEESPRPQARAHL